MLEPATKTKLSSYLTSDVTATTTTLIDSGLIVWLAANSTYHINSVIHTNANGDGTKLKFLYSGTLASSLLLESTSVVSSGNAVAINSTELLSTAVDEVWYVSGIVRTGASGKLYVQFAKNTDVTDDTPMAAGSYLVATLL